MDYFSRNAIEEIKNNGEDVEQYINTLVDYQLPMSIILEAVREETQNDQA